jgi:formylglycine-generating enzyme required for sulfatase activity
VAVTCRSRSFVGAVAAPFAEWGDPVTLAPFTLGQITHFVRGWYASGAARGALSTAEADQRTDELLGRFAALATLRDLGKTPLLLTIITILHFYDGKLPEDRADLYEDMVQLLLTRWTQQRREAGAAQSLIERLAIPSLKETQLRQTLAALAYRAHQGERSPDGRGLLEQAAVREAFTALFTTLGLAPGAAYEKALAVLEYLEDESGLLLHEGGERYAFPHLTYEEYLAGTHLVAQDSAVRPLAFQQLAYAHWQDDPARWREVILLALGHAVRLPRLETAALWLQYLCLPHHGEQPRDTAALQRAALFAADGLADIGGRGQLATLTTLDLPALWGRLAALLAEAVAGTHLPAEERVRAGVYLGELGDPRAGVCTLPPAMVAIPGGTFQIGITEEEHQRIIAEERANNLADEAKRWYERSINQQPLLVHPFELARYPVTNAQYALFMENGGYDSERPWWDAAGRAWLQGDGRQEPRYWRDERFGAMRPNHPVVGISWYEAVAFCCWLTNSGEYNPKGAVYLLPSEAEWEYAARGAERRMYAWGNDSPDGERANYGRTHDGTTAVGCFPSGATPNTGLLDMTGNIYEWTRSVYQSYPYNPNDGREQPKQPDKKRFTLRGGSWDVHPIYLRAVFRSLSSPDDFYGISVGFRLARCPPRVKD